jgi:hypothetical protein
VDENMSEFIGQHLAHFIALVVFLSRLGDIGTTYLVSPTLKLEANSIARRFGWKFALATLAVSAVPYYSIPLGIVIATASLLVSASNAMKIMAARALGEQAYVHLVQTVVSRTTIGMGVVYMLLPAAFYTLLGGMMLFFFPDPASDWGFYFALGILTYAFATSFWGVVRFITMKKKEGKESPNESPEPIPTLKETS